jgi:drug/metabolite transporter (DMT)-like permease
MFGSLLVAIDYLRGQPTSKRKLIGMFTSIVGAILISLDPNAHVKAKSQTGEDPNETLGTIVALAINIPYVFFFLVNNRLKKVIKEDGRLLRSTYSQILV